ncbi:hypothetical protein PG991_011349 [Apiospora marii]|uniref:SMP-30/Gluconolactonase/LRE-like region domain-containing protein n=1 Tax=Apiospora marii TaxID=335849 RepID=A0ABR1RDX1_9PEZI
MRPNYCQYYLRQPLRVLPSTYLSRDPDPSIGYTDTKVPDDPSWKLVRNAEFALFDKERGLEVFGRAPKIARGIIWWLNVIHEVPVFVPEMNGLFVTQDGPPGNMSILRLDLSQDLPTHGKNSSLSQHAGIFRFDPKTLEAEWLLNNYHGFNFAGPNELALAPLTGDIWITDIDYAYAMSVQIVDTSLQYPNGIQFSHDGVTLYIAGPGLKSYSPVAIRGAGDFYNCDIYIQFNSTAARTVFVLDVDRWGPQKYPALEGAPDGLKAAHNGYLVITGGLAPGVDITDGFGNQIARVQTSHPVKNIEWSGDDLNTLWLVGINGITKVEFDLNGPNLS